MDFSLIKSLLLVKDPIFSHEKKIDYTNFLSLFLAVNSLCIFISSVCLHFHKEKALPRL